MATSPIDLSAGLVPASAAPPGSGGGIDLSAGLVPASAPPPSAGLTDNPNGEGTYQMKTPAGVQAVPYSKVSALVNSGNMQGVDFANPQEYARWFKDKAYDPNAKRDDYVPPEIEQAKGALKSAVEVPNTIAGWLDSLQNHITDAAGVSRQAQARPTLEKAENAIAPGITNPTHGLDQGMGATAETLLEWAYGEGEAKEAVKGMSVAEKMQKAAGVAKFLSEHPGIAKAAGIGVRAGVNAAGATAQGMLHGQNAGDAAEGGLIAGGAGAALEGGLAGIGAAREAYAGKEAQTVKDAEQYLQDLAQHKQDVGAATGNAVDAMKAERQASAQASVRTTAQNATESALNRFNDALSQDSPHKVDAASIAQNATHFGDAADNLREAAKPVYEAINQATEGKFDKLQKMRSRAIRMNDPIAAEKAEGRIDTLLNTNPGVSGQDWRAAKSAWHDSKDLDKIHAAVEGAFNGVPEDIAADDQTGNRELRGTSLQTKLGNLLKGPKKLSKDRLAELVGPDGVVGLYRAAHLTSTPELKAATRQLTDQIVAQMSPPKSPVTKKTMGELGRSTMAYAVGSMAGHALGISGGGEKALLAQNVWRKIVTDPKVGQMAQYAVDYGANPERAAKVIAAMISSANAQH